MSDLAARDAEILRLYGEELPRREIAERVNTTINVVENVIKLHRKLRAGGSSVSVAGSGGPLAYYEAACRALSEARSVADVKELADQAEALRVYARLSEDREAETLAGEVRIRARRRLGAMIAHQKETVGLARPGPKPEIGSDEEPNSVPTLADVGISKKLSSEAQRLAAIPEDDFETRLAERRERALAGTERIDVDITRARPQNAGRVEDAESLDFSPTPPWATRALFEHVLPSLGVRAEGQAWEPACGEGHIAEILGEYFDRVVTSDIHDYGYRLDGLVDFTAETLELTPVVDWIVTNPPFGDRVLPFMRLALERAGAGVALFLQLRYLEGVDRYEQVFRDRPPTIIAPFVERVPLHMGRYEPDGSTMTAFMWLVWIKGRAPQAPFWIPPGCREALTKPDDRERFTAHPVRPRAAIDEPYDPETGEIIEPNAPGPSNRNASAGDEPSPEAAPQGEASLVGTDSGTPAGHEGQSPEGEGEAPASSSPALDAGEIPAFLRRPPEPRAGPVSRVLP